VIQLRLTGTREEIDVALARLRQSFMSVTASPLRPLRTNPAQVRTYVTARF
jgi:hypothetical protein